MIEHCGRALREPSPGGTGDERLAYLGDDADGVPLEVLAVEVEDGGLYVIHSMPLRAKYRAEYEEAKAWRV